MNKKDDLPQTDSQRFLELDEPLRSRNSLSVACNPSRTMRPCRSRIVRLPSPPPMSHLLSIAYGRILISYNRILRRRVLLRILFSSITTDLLFQLGKIVFRFAFLGRIHVSFLFADYRGAWPTEVLT
jgi:hypothetical protein